VTFATTTNFESAELPVVLFCHPMGAARYLIYMFEKVARKEGVRVLIIDRYVFPPCHLTLGCCGSGGNADANA
jgi:hypothetical protein